MTDRDREVRASVEAAKLAEDRGDPYGEGYEAHDLDEPLSSNPHRLGSANAADWEIGWWDADIDKDR